MRGEGVDRHDEGAAERPPRRPSSRILAGLYAHELTRTQPPEGRAEELEEPVRREPARASAD